MRSESVKHPPVRNGAGTDRRDFLRAGGRFAMAAAVTGPGLTILSGCGSSSGGSGGSAKEISFWQFYGPGGPVKGQSQWFVDLADDWNKSHDVKVKLRYIPNATYISGSVLQTAFAAGKGPDVFLLSPGDFLRYYNGGTLMDLTDYMGKEAIADFAPGTLTTRSVDNRVYGIPMEIEPLAIYYSTKAFEKAGLSESDLPTTWDATLELARKLKTKKQYGILFETTPGYYQNFTWYPFMWQGGGSPVGKDGKSSAFDSTAVANALNFWRQSIQEGVAPRKPLGTGAGDAPSNIGSGYTAMQQTGIWSVAELAANRKGFEYGVFKLPTPPGGQYATVLGGWAFVANKRGANPEQAAKFCAWALGSMSKDSIERARVWDTVVKTDIPPRLSVRKAAQQRGVFQNGVLKTFLQDIAPGGRGEPRYPPEVYQAISQAVQAAQLKGTDPKAAASQASQTIGNFLQSYSGAPLV